MSVEIKVISEAEAEKADYVVCSRVCDGGFPVMPNSYKARCFSCDTEVWVSPSAPLTPPRVCFVCACELAAGRH